MNEEQMATLRRYISEPTQDTYTDARLQAIYADLQDISAVAAQVWREKAASAATLVDMSEGASSRKMSQVYDMAAKQAAYWDGVSGATPTPTTTRSARTRAISRP